MISKVSNPGEITQERQRVVHDDVQLDTGGGLLAGAAQVREGGKGFTKRALSEVGETLSHMLANIFAIALLFCQSNQTHCFQRHIYHIATPAYLKSIKLLEEQHIFT